MESVLYVGLDVHKSGLSIATAEGERVGEVKFVGEIPNTPSAVEKMVKNLQRKASQIEFCYEAGPCGYGIYRQIAALGLNCIVVAPSLIPKASGDKIKTDRRDAQKLAVLHRSGDLVSVWVPDATHEAMRDLVRARTDARSPERKALMFQLEQRFRDPTYLRRSDVTLDRLGYLIESSVHNWMHLRFSGVPPQDTENESVANDWLARPFSSHVNPYFWRLHGWIDDCITAWENARGESADFAQAWRAPMIAPPWDELEATSSMISASSSGHKSSAIATEPFFWTPQTVLDEVVSEVLN